MHARVEVEAHSQEGFRLRQSTSCKAASLAKGWVNTESYRRWLTQNNLVMHTNLASTDVAGASDSLHRYTKRDEETHVASGACPAESRLCGLGLHGWDPRGLHSISSWFHEHGNRVQIHSLLHHESGGFVVSLSTHLDCSYTQQLWFDLDRPHVSSRSSITANESSLP